LLVLIVIPIRDTRVFVGIVVISPEILPYFKAKKVVSNTKIAPINPDKMMTIISLLDNIIHFFYG